MAISRTVSSRSSKRRPVANRSSRTLIGSLLPASRKKSSASVSPSSRKKSAPAKRGFAAMPVQKRKAIAAKGGRARKSA